MRGLHVDACKCYLALLVYPQQVDATVPVLVFSCLLRLALFLTFADSTCNLFSKVLFFNRCSQSTLVASRVSIEQRDTLSQILRKVLSNKLKSRLATETIILLATTHITVHLA